MSFVLLINKLREVLRERHVPKKRTSIRLSNDLAIELLEASIKFNEVAETLEVQLDKDTVRRLRIGKSEYSSGQHKVAHNATEIDTIFSGRPTSCIPEHRG